MLKNKKYLYDPPVLLKKLFNNYQWNSNGEKVLLTFDDGPNPNTTDSILQSLDKHSIKAVFFCVGENLQKYPAIAKEIISQGHTLGNHTQSHKKLTELTSEQIIESISEVQQFSENKLSYKIEYFRPPHGRFTFGLNNILRINGLKNIMWSLLTYDYKNELNIVKFAINNYLNKSSIVVLHDSNKSKDIISDSINYIIESTNKNNYQIGKPSECLNSYS